MWTPILWEAPAPCSGMDVWDSERVVRNGPRPTHETNVAEVLLSWQNKIQAQVNTKPENKVWTQYWGPYYGQSVQISHQIQQSGSCPPAIGTMSFWHQSQDQQGRWLRPPLSTNTPETQEGVKGGDLLHNLWTSVNRHWSRLLQSLSEEVKPVRQCGMQLWWAWTDCRTYNHRLPLFQPRSWRLQPGTRDEGWPDRADHLMIYERRMKLSISKMT